MEKRNQLTPEYRFFNFDNAKVRAVENSDGDNKQIIGYGSIFNHDSRLLWDWFEGYFIERIDPAAFDNVLNSEQLDTTLNRNHNDDFIIARTRAGNLHLNADDYGLKYTGDIGTTSAARDAYEDVKAGNLYESSFAFNFHEDDVTWSENAEGVPVRTIHNISRLYDVSVVTRGAYSNTDVSARALDQLQRMDPALYKRGADLQKPNLIKAKRRLFYINQIYQSNY